MTAEDLLRERARQLARPPDDPDDVPRRSLLRFRRADDRFAVWLETVRQVVRVDAAAWLPSASWPLLALAPLGDQIIPVLDVAGVARPTTARAALSWGVAVMVGTQQLIIAADQVLDVVDRAEDEITGTGALDDQVASGITTDGDAVVDLEMVHALLAPTLVRDATSPTASTRSPHP